MKKILYFIPAIVACLFYGPFMLIGSVELIGYIFCALWIVSSLILFKGKWWGCLPGIIAGIWLAFLDLQATGQIVRQWPIGIVFCIYYAICGFLIYKIGK